MKKDSETNWLNKSSKPVFQKLVIKGRGKNSEGKTEGRRFLLIVEAKSELTEGEEQGARSAEATTVRVSFWWACEYKNKRYTTF